jgi:alpha-L-rhamnosidase
VQFSTQQPLPPVNLKVEYLTNPLGVDIPNPRLFWTPMHKNKDQLQTAYQIQLVGVWDSQQVKSNQSTQVVYNGTPLKSNTLYRWRVRWWDKQDVVSDWSANATFQVGLLTQQEWTGKWLTGDLLRKNFTIQGTPQLVFAYIAGIGYSELYINGRKVGKDVINPAWTTYNIRTLYSTYDISNLLVPGENVIGIMLGNGWYGHFKNQKRVIFQLQGDTSSGPIKIVSDASWKTHSGPVTYDDVYNGENYDATLEIPGWNDRGFNDKDWQAAPVIAPPGGVLSSQLMQPIQAMNVVKPVKITTPIPNTYVVDFGQNFSGWVRIRAKGARGTKITIRHAEVLNPNGTLYVVNLRSAKATDTFTMRGTGSEEIYEPRFTYHGFRYIEVKGYPGQLSLDALEGLHVYSAVATVGQFSSSSKVLNQIQKLIWWGQTSNLMGIPTDCPQRDERLGWTADAVLAAEEAVYNFDMGAFYTNFIRDIYDNQNGDSPQKGVMIADTVPNGPFGGYPADPAWGTAYPDITYFLYQHYGDTNIVRTYYEGIKKWVQFLYASSQKDGVQKLFSKYGDWVPPPPQPRTSGNLVSTFFVIQNLIELAEFANILGKGDEAKQFNQQAQTVAQQFHHAWFNTTAKYYEYGLQAAQSFALQYSSLIIPNDLKQGVVDHLVADIKAHNTHLTTGIWGTKYIMDVLSENGHIDVALQLAQQTTYPSWGYMIYNDVEPATTLWELWNSPTGDAGMDSRNHIMFGSIGAWFYKYLAGIKPMKPGYEVISLNPAIKLLDKLNAEYNSIRGRIIVSWDRNSQGNTELQIEIPVNTVAHVKLEVPMDKMIWSDHTGIKSTSESGKMTTVIIGSGNYSVLIKQ